MKRTDEEVMRRAVALGMRGRGGVEPNPMVGCVMMRGERVIGEGWHRRFGQGHAEAEALRNCTEDPRGGTAYVTLEPCCHLNKKTPPCVPALIGAGLARVVVGCVDPNPAVSGRGFEQLRTAGVEVETGVLEAECRQLIAPFLAGVVHHRAYVTLKWAQSADGKVAGAEGRPVRISNEQSWRTVHELRGRCDAILVGINTVLSDDPLLNARGVDSVRPLKRYVMDRQLRIPLESRLVQSAGEVPLLVATEAGALAARAERAKQLRALGVELIAVSSLRQLIGEMYGRGATHLLVEPGPTLARAFVEGNLADRVWLYRSPVAIGDGSAPAAAEVAYAPAGQVELGGDVLSEHLNPGSAVFFANVPSADLDLVWRNQSMRQVSEP